MFSKAELMLEEIDSLSGLHLLPSLTNPDIDRNASRESIELSGGLNGIQVSTKTTLTCVLMNQIVISSLHKSIYQL